MLGWVEIDERIGLFFSCLGAIAGVTSGILKQPALAVLMLLIFLYSGVRASYLLFPLKELENLGGDKGIVKRGLFSLLLMWFIFWVLTYTTLHHPEVLHPPTRSG